MKKIPTLFVRDTDDHGRLRYVRDEINPGCEWVADGQGVATRKYDGTCVYFDGIDWWARREVKPGKMPPAGFRLMEQDSTTGKAFGWEPAPQSAFYKYLSEALDYHAGQRTDLIHGTYELIGPKVNGNPESASLHFLVPHGRDTFDEVPRDFAGLRNFLWSKPTMEGLVFHHPDGRMAKIKRRDFPSKSEDSAVSTA